MNLGKLGVRFFVFVFSAFAAVAHAADDAIWINQGIRDAIDAGQSSYTIPAGVYNLESLVVIPYGTKNFALYGAGPDQTILTTPNIVLSQVISVGYMGYSHNNWGLTNQDNYDITSTVTGDSTVQLLDGQDTPPTGTYVVWDLAKVRHTNGLDSIYVNADMVDVIGYNSTSKRAYLDTTLGREFELTPKMANVTNVLTENITVADIGFDGLVSGTTNGSYGLVKAGLVKGLTLSNLKVRNFAQGGVYTWVCRDVLMENLDIADATALGPGAGYGVWVTRSRFVTVRDSVAVQCRHGFVMHGGTMDALVENCVSNGAGFDTHGMDERRITLRNCSGTVAMDFGNDAWLAGGQDILVDNCNITGQITVRANMTGVVVQNSSAKGVGFRGITYDADAIPNGGWAGTFTAYDSYFTSNNGNGLITPYQTSKMEKAKFVRCTFTQTNSSWGYIHQSQPDDEGILEFIGCTFHNTSNRTPIVLDSEMSNTLVTMQDCEVISDQGASKAVVLSSPAQGRYNFANNVFRTPNSAPEFHSNYSTAWTQYSNNLSTDLYGNVLDASGTGEENPPTDGTTDGSGGTTDGSGGTTDGSGGTTDGSGGTTDGSGGTTDGSGGTTDGSGGTTDGSGGTTDGSGGTTDGSGGTTDGSGGTTDGTTDSTTGGNGKGNGKGGGGNGNGKGGGKKLLTTSATTTDTTDTTTSDSYELSNDYNLKIDRRESFKTKKFVFRFR